MDGHENDVDALGQSSATPESTTPVAPTEGGIFSGSDTRIETENLPEVVPEVIQQAPMSAISPALRTESTVTSDLHLGGTAKKKKWPFIATAAGVAVVVILGGWLLLSNSRNESGAKNKAQTTFNQFSNYYLYGTDSADNIQGGYDSNTVYKASIAMEEGDMDFFNKAKNYYDTFMQAYEQDIRATQQTSDSEDISDYFNGDVVVFTQMFDFIYRFAMAPALTSEEIFGVFINTDYESAQQFVNNYYSSLADTTYELGTRYAKERTIYDLSQVDQYHIYKDSDCIEGETIKDNCAVDFKKYDMTRLEEAAEIANSDILQFPDDVVEGSIEQLYLIQKENL